MNWYSKLKLAASHYIEKIWERIPQQYSTLRYDILKNIDKCRKLYPTEKNIAVEVLPIPDGVHIQDKGQWGKSDIMVVVMNDGQPVTAFGRRENQSTAKFDEYITFGQFQQDLQFYNSKKQKPPNPYNSTDMVNTPEIQQPSVEQPVLQQAKTNWYKSLFAASRHVELRPDLDQIVEPRMTRENFFHSYVFPTAKKLYPETWPEHYSFAGFMNMCREMTALDNRRRDKDKVFTDAGTQIKSLTDQCIAFAPGTKEFNKKVVELVKRLHKWYFDESASGGFVQRPNKQQVNYKSLQELGIYLTQNQGKMLSEANPRTPEMKIIRDDFMAAQNELIKGNKQPILDWWTVYKDELPTPVFYNTLPRHPQRPQPQISQQPTEMPLAQEQEAA